MTIKKGAKEVFTSDFWYDLTRGGYIKPAKLVVAEDAKRVAEAIKTIQEFEKTLEDNGLLSQI